MLPALVTVPSPPPLPRQPFRFLKPCSWITLVSTRASTEREETECLKQLNEHSVYRNTHFHDTSNYCLVNLSHQSEGRLQVNGYLLSFSRAISALWGPLNNFSTSRFCTDVSDALSLCNPRYTLYADGREDLLEMIAHGELTSTHPACRPLTMLLSTLFYQSQKNKASFGVNLFLNHWLWHMKSRWQKLSL